jgi:hypothetical protein
MIRRSPSEALIEKCDLVTKFHESVAYGIRNAFIEE